MSGWAMGWDGGRDRRLWLVVFLLAAAVVGGSRWRVAGQSGSGNTAGLIPVGRREATPNMALEQLNGGTWRLADHRGHVVVMNFWATWCEPCREEMPALSQVMRQDAPEGVTMVSVAMDTTPDAEALVRQFAAQYRMTWPVAFPNTMLRMESQGIGVPTTVLLDTHGRRAKTYVGEVDRATLTKDIAALLAES